MILKPCPRCKKLIPCGMAYCAECKPIAESEWKKHKKEAAEKRKHMHKSRKRDRCYSFYNSVQWKKTSKAKLASCGWKCEAHIDEQCTGLATEVHHIIPIQTEEGWALRLDWDNLEAVCVHCHNVRHHKGKHRDDVRRISELT